MAGSEEISDASEGLFLLQMLFFQEVSFLFLVNTSYVLNVLSMSLCGYVVISAFLAYFTVKFLKYRLG